MAILVSSSGGSGSQPWPPALDASNEATLVEAQLEGRRILAFSRGGERRLCLPQVLGLVLQLCPDAALADIQLACDRLGITCLRCTQRQSARLGAAAVAIVGSLETRCGLMRQSDAERLCKTLLAGRMPRLDWPVGSGPGGVPVVHRCFGKQRGLLLPRLFNRPGAPCVACAGCGRMLSPAQFVGHAHGTPREAAATCHWGFDSANWRLYLGLDWRRAEPHGAARLEMVKAKVWLKRANWVANNGDGESKKLRGCFAQEVATDSASDGRRATATRQLGGPEWGVTMTIGHGPQFPVTVLGQFDDCPAAASSRMGHGGCCQCRCRCSAAQK